MFVSTCRYAAYVMLIIVGGSGCSDAALCTDKCCSLPWSVVLALGLLEGLIRTKGHNCTENLGQAATQQWELLQRCTQDCMYLSFRKDRRNMNKWLNETMGFHAGFELLEGTQRPYFR